MISKKKLPVLGMVITQKNEAAILNYNIAYHRYMGVSHFYIYDDGSSDDSMDTVPDREGIFKFYETDFSNISAAMETVKQKALGGNWIGRQILNTYNALKLAKGHGVDWLFFIDADELVYLGSQKENSFLQVFMDIEEDVEVVHISEVLEVAQNAGNNKNVFSSATHFKTIEYDNTKERKIPNPMTGEIFTLKGFLGHHDGKQVARVDADLIPTSSHIFKRRNREIPTRVQIGSLLHYHGCSFDDFINKNSIPHPSHFVFGGEVPYYPKLFWRELVQKSGMSKVELQAYFEKWIMISDGELKQLLEESKYGNPVLIEWTAISEIWEEITNRNFVNANFKA